MTSSGEHEREDLRMLYHEVVRPLNCMLTVRRHCARSKRTAERIGVGMSRRPRIGLLLFVLSWAPASIGATMYKCQAPDGRVTYMDQPCPPGNVTEKRIEPAAAPPAPAAKEPSREAVPPSPYRRPQPVVVPPLPPPPDLSRFPKDSKGRPIIAGNSNYALVIDDDAKMQPVNVISACGELITGCVKPSERSLDACFMSVPRCASARPWEDPAYKPCCPAQCWTQYEERRIAGMAPIAAFRATLYGRGEGSEAGCIPIQ